MELEICSFASGSSGNCYLIRGGNTSLLLDVGISGKKIFEALANCDLTIEDINGVLITHEHIDHMKSIKMISKKAQNAKVYASAGTMNCIDDKVEPGKKVIVCSGQEFEIGDISVRTFNLSHDASEPLGYSFSYGGKTATVVTDTGCITEEIFENMVESDLIVLEANHEVNILKVGRYPYKTKLRILGDSGHLSNEACGHCIGRLIKEREKKALPKIALAHISREHNSPEQAKLTIKNILFEEDIFVGKQLEMDVLSRDEMTFVGEI